MSLTISTIARGRPELLLKTIELTLPNIARSDTVYLICLDDDDPGCIEIAKKFPKDPRLRVSIKPREDSRGEKYDRALTEAPASLYLPYVDHAPIMTAGFDEILLEKAATFPDGLGCVYSEWWNASWPKFQAITAGLVAKIGYIYNHAYPYWFIDHELDDMARMIGRYICTEIEVDNTSMRPEKTLELRDLKFWVNYFDVSILRRRLLAASIIDSADFICPQWQKEMLKTWYHPTEARSWAISCSVIKMADQIEAQRGTTAEPEPRYLRIKEKAEKAMREMAREFVIV